MDSNVNYGQEIGPNLIKITKKLLKNQNLLRLLVYTDKDPLNRELHSDFDDPLKDIYGKNIRNVPMVFLDDLETTESKIAVVFTHGDVDFGDNQDNESLRVLIYVYTPYNEWIMAGNNLRPYAIISEIRRSLQGKTINGLGKIKYIGFDLASLTPQVSSFVVEFSINAFS